MRRSGWLSFLFTLMIFSGGRTASAQALSWVRQFGTEHRDGASAVAVDATGVYVVGSTGVVLGAPVYRWFLRKYDALGNDIWTREFELAEGESVRALAADSTGVYIAGEADRLPGQTTLGFGDAFIRKYDAGGNELWTRQFGTSSRDYATGVVVDGAGVYVVGDTLDNLPGQGYAGEFDVFIRKYGTNGAEIWTRQFGSSSYDYSRGVAADSTGVYIVGVTEGSLPGQARRGGSDAFVRKYDAGGNELWTRQFGSAATDAASAVAANDAGIYITGVMDVLDRPYSGQPFVRRYDLSGTEMWTTKFGNASADELTAVAATASAIYAAGKSMGPVPGRPGSQTRNPAVRKYDINGNEVWAFQFGSYSAFDTVAGVAADASGVYAAGSTSGFPGESYAGDSDAFVVKIGIVGSFTSVSAANYSSDSPLAPQSIASGFGEGLARATESAVSLPLPTSLAGASVTIEDSAGTERQALLFFVSPTQINYLIPAGSATGRATTTVIAEDQVTSIGSIRIEAVGPGLFSANAQGTGVAAGTCLRVSADGSRTEDWMFDPPSRKAVPIDLGPSGDQIYLSLFGTGIRGFRSAVGATVGGRDVPVIGAAAQPQFAGVDQVNIGPLPRNLAGRGEVDIVISVDGKRANVVTVAVK
jgi:uncharacterized protein (TIGR03437 family)